MDKLLTQSLKTDERDKILKIFQYSSIILKTNLQDKDSKSKFQNLQTASTMARKMFRMFKGIIDLDQMIKISSNKSLDFTSRFLQFMTRLTNFLYFFYDNFATLSTLKVIDINTAKFGRNSSTAWFWSLVFALANFLRNLYVNHLKMTKLKQDINPSSDIENLRKERLLIFMNVVKTCGDLLPATAGGTDIAIKLCGKNVPDTWIGIGGLISALIGLWQAWP